ncbi:MAG: hydroxymethylpyrimidine/phosphomethylpyrimidine kinase [Proteobacteria bacterium]|nr:hydroxymethylpyrimidine/phosphomethylpyrimidine kinase [Pseudomonadota bacterium]
MTRRKPVVLFFSGSDPTSGAGLQADVLTVAQLDCHPLTVITSITIQNTRDVLAVFPVGSDLIRDQVRTLLLDIEVDAFKIGMIPNADVLQEIIAALKQFPDKPIIFDPVLSAGGGYQFVSSHLAQQVIKELLPRSLIVTPNTKELEVLVGAVDASLEQASNDERALRLVKAGAKFVLVTGAHADSRDVENRLYDESGFVDSWTWPRLAGEYHGSGCTLASAISGYLANGSSVIDAVFKAQQFTWNSLESGYRIGGGQLIPNRNKGK